MAELSGERSIVIQAPPHAVYDDLSDFPRHAEWNHQPMEITKVTEGPIEVGSVFRTKEQAPAKAPWLVRKVMLPLIWKIVGFVGYTEVEITAMEPGRRLAWEASAPLRNGGYWLTADYEILLKERNGPLTLPNVITICPSTDCLRTWPARPAPRGSARRSTRIWLP